MRKGISCQEIVAMMLKKCVFNLPDWSVINEIDVLSERHSTYFADYSAKKGTGFFCIVPYNHHLVNKLGKYSFNPLP